MSPLSVLVVDDDPDHRYLVRRSLELGSHCSLVGEAPTIGDAIEETRRLQPDVVLLDLLLPDGDGLTAIPSLVEASPASKIIVLSSFSRHEGEHASIQSGAVGYLEKGGSPFLLSDDIAILAGALHVVTTVMNTIALPAERTAPAAARRFVTSLLRRWHAGAELETIELLVSELVTNAVMHARSPVTVAVSVDADRLRVDVSDDGSGRPAPRRPSLDDVSGRGLFLVERLASSWGTKPNPSGGKTVWFTVPRPREVVTAGCGGSDEAARS